MCRQAEAFNSLSFLSKRIIYLYKPYQKKMISLLYAITSHIMQLLLLCILTWLFQESIDDILFCIWCYPPKSYNQNKQTNKQTKKVQIFFFVIINEESLN
jgi:hypothetical protein